MSRRASKTLYPHGRSPSQSYQWPRYRMRLWLFVMLLASASILGVSATFLQTQSQMRLPIPWYLAYDAAVSAVALAFLLAVAWLLWMEQLDPAVVMLGVAALFVLWMVGLGAGGVALWGPRGVQGVCEGQVWSHSPHAPDVQTLAWMQQRNICQSWYLVFAMGFTGAIFLIWGMIIAYGVFVGRDR